MIFCFLCVSVLTPGLAPVKVEAAAAECTNQPISGRIIWIGDSRTALMEDGRYTGQLGIEMAPYQGKDLFFAAHGEGYDWMVAQLPAICSALKPGDTIVVNMGVNDYKRIGHQPYVQKLNELVEEEWKDYSVVFMSINPVDDAKTLMWREQRPDWIFDVNATIEEHNARLKAGLSSKIQWLDTYSYLKSQGSMTSQDYMGVHYDNEGLAYIYRTVRTRGGKNSLIRIPVFRDAKDGYSRWIRQVKDLANDSGRSSSIKQVIGSSQSGQTLAAKAENLVEKCRTHQAGYQKGGKSYLAASGENIQAGFDSAGFVTWLMQTTFSGAAVSRDLIEDFLSYPGSLQDSVVYGMDLCSWRHIAFMDMQSWVNWLYAMGVYNESYSWQEMSIDSSRFSAGSLIVYFDQAGHPTNMAVYTGKTEDGTDMVAGSFRLTSGTFIQECSLEVLNNQTFGNHYRIYAFEHPGE